MSSSLTSILENLLYLPHNLNKTEMADVALGVVGVAPVVLQYPLRAGIETIKFCKAIKNAPEDFYEQVVRVENNWLQIKHQLDQDRTDAMTEEQRQSHRETTRITLFKLETVHKELLDISKSIRPGEARDSDLHRRMRVRFACKKQALVDAIDVLEQWRGLLKASSVLVNSSQESMVCSPGPGMTPSSTGGESATVVCGQTKSFELGKFLPAETLRNVKRIPVAMSSFSVITMNQNRYLIDAFSYDPAPPRSACPISRDVRTLARKIEASQDHLAGLLSCKGVVASNTTGPSSLALLFRLPAGFTEPRSLRDTLMSTPAPPLSDIVQIGQNIAEAISLVHAFGFVHKNIRPETVVIRRDETSGRPSAFLIGFEKLRLDLGMTHKLGDEIWGQNLYRHPSRHGQSPVDYFVMQHDIYSLGVCLLEIGLWESFVHTEQTGSSSATRTRPSDWFQQNAKRSEGGSPVLLKQDLVALASDLLPRRMGYLYTNLVKTCLTCLDTNNEDFGDESEFLDGDGILVGVRYVEKVCVSSL
ncbi:serine/threonine protein kinase [Beauveria bassiana ARSEF 2860]|uniref:Serine/threonine protein kinase n=1 Tax=Beauveria bassiana (strain ARSEF 2860) TaxID=655819 RepID=J4UKU2_BEAB2|nr:serine/threonine protein kinase [Beauveria bassiana ARSEF 2860]EJP64952.1 serine/threonine protein kinase [Beauveria bassiana ARSEF 2860]